MAIVIDSNRCFQCEATEEHYERELMKMRADIDAMDRELQAAMQDRDIFQDEAIKLKRQVYRLTKAAEGDPQAKKNDKPQLIQDAREFLNLWYDLRCKHFRPDKRIILDHEGSRGQLYLKKRKLWSHEDLVKCVKGVELSDFHVSLPRYFEPKSFLREDERIQQHIERFENWDRLTQAGFKDEKFKRSMVQRTYYSEPPQLGWQCPGCGSHSTCFCETDKARRLAA